MNTGNEDVNVARGRLRASLWRVPRIPPSVLLVAPCGSVNTQTKCFVDLTDSWDAHGRHSDARSSQPPPRPARRHTASCLRCQLRAPGL